VAQTQGGLPKKKEQSGQICRKFFTFHKALDSKCINPSYIQGRIHRMKMRMSDLLQEHELNFGESKIYALDFSLQIR
jgi:hypothetical protein